MVLRGGRDDGYRLNGIEQRVEGRERGRLELGRDLGGALRAAVVDTGEPGAGKRRVPSGMMETQAAHPGDADGERRSTHTMTPRSLDSMNVTSTSSSGHDGTSARTRSRACVMLSEERKK